MLVFYIIKINIILTTVSSDLMNKKINTKEKIFEVAIDLFSKKGYDGVSIREIAKNVGIKESSIYNHYSSKKSILDSILNYFISEMTNAEFSEKDINLIMNTGLSNFYKEGSIFYKSKIKNPKMMKIMRIIIIESYHNEKIKNFMKKELINAPIEGWTNIFELMKSKKIIKKDTNSKDLAKSYYGYGLFLLIEHFIFNYGENDNKFIENFFKIMEEHINLIFDAVVINNQESNIKTLTYNLKNFDYYNDIESFTDYILEESEKFINEYKEDILKYIKDNKNSLRDDKFIEDELTFELLMIGILWIIYAQKALKSNIEYHDLMKQLFKVRSNLNPDQKELKDEIDEIRGYLGTIVYLDYINRDKNSDLSLENLDKLISWLETTGEFHYELKAIYPIRNYLSTKNKEDINNILQSLIEFGKFFIKESKKELGKYTSHVNEYINNNIDLNINSEDMVFCNRKESEYHLNMFGAEVMNRLFKKEFDKRERKAVLLPSCMKSNQNICKSKDEKLGEVCNFCNNNCAIAKVSKKGLKEGFETYIIPHESSAFANATKKDKEELGIIGVSCVLNLISGGWKAESLKIPPQCVLLDYVGCSNHWDEKGFPTNISLKELDKKLQLN